MKKYIALIIAALMILSANVVSFAAGYSFSVTITADKTSLDPGDSFTAAFTLSNITAEKGLIGLDMIVKYDADRLEPVSAEGIYPDEWGTTGADFSPEPEKENGKYTGVWKTYVLYDGDDEGHGVRENKVFGIALTFKVKEDAAAGAAVIKVETDQLLTATTDDLETVSGKGAELRVVVRSGDMLKLKSSSSYKLENAYVKGVVVGTTAEAFKGNFENENVVVKTASGAEAANGKAVGTGYTAELVADGKTLDYAVAVVKGDTDGNGTVDATDYILIKKHFLSLTYLDGAYFAAADTDGNNAIDATDYIMIKRHILGISLLK